MTSKNLVGKTAYIKKNVGRFFEGYWGIIVDVDADGMYHIAMFGDETDCPIFSRNEFVVHRQIHK